MSAPKRARACDACHGIKIKCELGTTGDPPPCSRCVRLGKDCIITPPKRQKDRVAELEAQVEALRKQLESQGIQSPTSDLSEKGTTQNAPLKKRRLEDDCPDSDISYQVSSVSSNIEIDAVVPRDLQEHIFEKYTREMMPLAPLVPLKADQDYSNLRKTRPIFLQAILYAACPAILPTDTQEDVAKIVLNLLAAATIAEGGKTYELVQALQIALLHYRTPMHHTHLPAFQLAPLLVGIAKDIGCSGSFGIAEPEHNINVADSWRTWLVCNLLSSVMNIFMRRPDDLTWGAHEDDILWQLENCEHGQPGDRLLCQFIRAERLCARIIDELKCCDFSAFCDISEITIQSTMLGLQNCIVDWKAQIPRGLRSDLLAYWEMALMLYVNEPVLYTRTNKQSFAAPYLADRLSVTDFPAPLVTPQHISALVSLKTNSKMLLDIFSGFDILEILSLPAILFASRVAYANFILVKLYIATTAPGNTFGAFLDPESLQVNTYLSKIIDIAATARSIDHRCGAARVLYSASRLQEWFLNYAATYTDHGTTTSIGNDDVLGDSVIQPNPPGEDVTDPWSEINFGDDMLNFGLEDLFADIPLVDWPSETLVPNDSSHSSIRLHSG